MVKLLIKFMLIMLVVSACRKKEIRLSYFDNGHVKEKVEIVDNKKNGTSWEYDSAGKLRKMKTWKDDHLNGPYEAYYASGKISHRGAVTPGKPCEMIAYYPSGKISEVYYFNGAGEVINARKLHEDGTVDLSAFTYVTVEPFGDVQKLRSHVTVRAKVLNVYDSIYLNGRMIITSRFNAKSDSVFPQVADTIAIVDPIDSFVYVYEFTPEKIGYDTIKGVIFFQKDLGEEIAIEAKVILFPYLVVE